MNQIYVNIPYNNCDCGDNIVNIRIPNITIATTAEWLQSYNKSTLQQHLQQTFEIYGTRKDRAKISRESVVSIENTSVLFKPQFTNPKYGPILSLYWQSRMMSFFSQFYKFKLVMITKFQKNLDLSLAQLKYKLFFKKRLYFFAFLPKEINIHAIDIDYDIYSKHQDFVLNWMLNRKKPQTLFIYGADQMDLMESKVFTDIMRYETNTAYNEYYKYNHKHKMQQLIENDMWLSKTDDVLIHIRCQDVLFNGARSYGMNSLHYLYYAITNVFNIKLHKNMAIHIVFHLDSEQLDFDGCISYLYEYVQPAFNKTFEPSQLKWIINGSINDDFYRFIKAPNVICGTSSYCLMGAIANENNVVLYKGWTNNRWYEDEDYDPFDLIADNIHFMDDPYFVPSVKIKQNKWNVSTIANKTMVIDGKCVL